MAHPVQSYSNHARFFPPVHFFVIPVLLLNVFYEMWHVWQTPNLGATFRVFVAAAIFGAALFARVQVLAVQDRVIRLEMRLRLRGILPPDLHPRINELTRAQMVALRFAGDEELPELVRDVLAGKLSTQKDIKLRVKNWQGDYLRA